MLILKKELATKKRIAIIAFMITALGLVTIYLQAKGISTVFTHLYYIPIILACIWWQRRAYAITAILGTMLITIHLLNGADQSINEDILRIGVMFIITLLASELSASERKYNNQVNAQAEDLKRAYDEIQKAYTELKDTNSRLADKLEENERLYKATIDRELAMAELKKKVSN